MSQPEQPQPQPRHGTEPDPRVVRGLGEYLRWHALHEGEHGGQISGPEYWQAVARGVLDGLNEHQMVVLSTEQHEQLVAAGRAEARQRDEAFGAGYQQCRDELDTVLATVPPGAAVAAVDLREALDASAGLQFETREARLHRYNEALRFLLEPDNLTWFRNTEPELMERLKTAVRKTQ